MSFFTRFSPLRAVRDLRGYLGQRKPYEVGFMMLAISITWTVIVVFARDTDVKADYVEPEVVFVQNYDSNRTDAEIVAQQQMDLPAEMERKREIEDAQRKRQESFKKIEDKMKAWGL